MQRPALAPPLIRRVGRALDDRPEIEEMDRGHVMLAGIALAAAALIILETPSLKLAVLLTLLV
jgi:hypothetical protein